MLESIKYDIEELKKNKVVVFKKLIIVDDKVINTAIFNNYNNIDLKIYKLKLFKEIEYKKKTLKKLKLNNEIFKNNINRILTIINFIMETYDIEAKKIDKFYNIENNKLPDYNYYSKVLFNISCDDLEFVNYLPDKSFASGFYLDKKKLISILEYIKAEIPTFKYRFWNYWNFSVSNVLNIPDKKFYNLNEVIVCFFHELTHFIRFYNQEKNLWFNYSFYDSNEFEEWLALYNEYKYWNMIVNYWKYYPYYNKIYNILIENINEEEKKNKIHNILKYKGFIKEKSNYYYYRFYRFAPLWWKDFFLRELIYYKSLKKITKLIEEQWYNIDYLMSWKFWTKTLDYFNSIVKFNNIDSEKLFLKIVDKIKSYV